jgi:hypothetical protein
MGVFYMLIPFLGAMMLMAASRSGRSWERIFFQAMSLGHPLIPTITLCVPDRPPFSMFDWEWCALIHLAGAALLTIVSAILLRRLSRREHERGGAPVSIPPLPFPSALPGADSTLPTPPRHYPLPSASAPIGNNPVLWRELRRPLLIRRWQRIFSCIFVIVVMLSIYGALAANKALTEVDAQIGFAFIFCGALNILACILAATAIAQEKESDTWTLLLATPLSARQIVWGKLAGLVRRLIWPAIFITIHFFLFTISGIIDPLTLLIVLWMIFTTNTIWLATGLYLSLRLRAVIFATILNLLGPLLIYAATAMVLAILDAFVNDFHRDLPEIVLLYAPYGWMAEAIDHLARHRSHDGLFWMPLFNRATLPEFLLAVFLVGCGHLLATWLAIQWTIRRFNTIVGRASQDRALAPPLASQAMPPAALSS